MNDVTPACEYPHLEDNIAYGETDGAADEGQQESHALLERVRRVGYLDDSARSAKN